MSTQTTGTLPWEMDRNGTTATFQIGADEKPTEDVLIAAWDANIARSHWPYPKGRSIEYINSCRIVDGVQYVCCGISWNNER